MLTLILDDSDTVNVARHRPTSQSSTSAWSAPDESARAVSGERMGSLAFHTEAEPFPWWMVDLQANYPIDAVVIWNRDDEFARRARTLRIHVSLDGVRWELIHQGMTYFGGLWTRRPLVHLTGGDVQARFVRVSLEEPVPLHLAQVEVLVSKGLFSLQRFWQSLTAREPSFPPFDPATAQFRYRSVRGSAAGTDERITALKVEPYGRFGNNFHQLFNAALLAKHWALDTVIVPRGGLLGVVPSGAARTIGGLRFVHEGEDPAQRALAGYFYFVDLFESFFAKIPLTELLDTLNEAVRPQYRTWLERVQPAAADTMHFHFRSGDVFMANTPHHTYLQPPLAYYTRALAHARQHLGIRRAVVVYEDLNNPCVTPFLEHLQAQAVEYRACSASLEEDVIELLGARIVCQSFSTLTESILCLSEHARVAYGFRDVEAFPGHAKLRGRGITQILAGKGLALHVVSDSTERYLERDTWRNTPEQRERMVAFAEDHLTVTTLKP